MKLNLEIEKMVHRMKMEMLSEDRRTMFKSCLLDGFVVYFVLSDEFSFFIIGVSWF